MYIYDLLTANGGSVTREGLLNVLAFVFALVFALTLHEIAHGLVALWNGDNTAKLYGRLSPNPLQHFDPVGLLMMLLVGFGWAKPVPVNPDNFKHRKLGCVTVSLAGVVMNLLLAFLFALLYVVAGQIPLDQGSTQYYLVYLLYMFALFMVSINISFALFNILPLYPLDGYRLLASFVNENNGYMRFARRYHLYIMLVLVALDYLADFLPSSLWWISPLQLYIGTVGGWIRRGFVSFWGLFV